MTDRLEEIRDHKQYEGDGPCIVCGEPWPCDRAYLLERLERAEKAVLEWATVYERDLSATRTRLEEVMKEIPSWWYLPGRYQTDSPLSQRAKGVIGGIARWLRGEPVVGERDG